MLYQFSGNSFSFSLSVLSRFSVNSLCLSQVSRNSRCFSFILSQFSISSLSVLSHSLQVYLKYLSILYHSSSVLCHSFPVLFHSLPVLSAISKYVQIAQDIPISPYKNCLKISQYLDMSDILI